MRKNTLDVGGKLIYFQPSGLTGRLRGLGRNWPGCRQMPQCLTTLLQFRQDHVQLILGLTQSVSGQFVIGYRLPEVAIGLEHQLIAAPLLEIALGLALDFLMDSIVQELDTLVYHLATTSLPAGRISYSPAILIVTTISASAYSSLVTLRAGRINYPRKSYHPVLK
jgi:hypothetical protein